MELKINRDAIDSAANFLVQYLRDAGYEGSLENGTGIYDIAIKGVAPLLAVFQGEAQKVKAYLSLKDAKELKSLLGEEYDTAIDSILSNWFVTRKKGVSSVVRFRMYFTRALDFLQFKAKDPLFNVSQSDFVVLEDQVFTTNNFIPMRNTINNTTEWYIEVTAKTADSDNVELSPLSSVSCYLLNVFYIRTTFVEKVLSGSEKESSDAFIERTKEVITTRELISGGAIKTVLMDTFDMVRSVYVAKYLSKELMRDIVKYPETDTAAISFHVGNKADIYINTPLSVKKVVREVINSHIHGNIIDLSDICLLDIYYIKKQDIIGNYTAVVYDSKGPASHTVLPIMKGELYGSMRAYILISVPEIMPGTLLEITCLVNELVKEVDTFVSSGDNCLVSYDPMVRSMFPVTLSFEMEVIRDTDLSGELTDDDLALRIKNLTTEYVDKTMAARSIYISDLVGYLHSLIPGIAHITLPIYVTYKLKNIMTLLDFAGDISNSFLIPANVSEQITWNTIQFYTNYDLIKVTIK